MKHRSPQTSPRKTQRGELTAKLLTWLYAFAVASNIALLFGAPLNGGFTPLELVVYVLNLPVERSLIALVTTVVIFWALMRRKRAGFWAVLFFQVIGTLLALYTALTLPSGELAQRLRPEHLTLGLVLNWTSVVLGTVLVFFMIRAYRAFPARTRRSSYGAALGVLAVGFLAALVACWIVLPVSSWQHVGSLMARALGANTPGIASALPHVQRWQVQIITTIYGLVAIAAIWVFLRSGKPTNSWSEEREMHLRRLLHQYGGQDSLSYFSTRREKSVIFSPDGRAAVAYRVIRSVSLAAGDPVGDPASWDAAIGQWKQEARTYGWIPAVLSTSKTGAAAYVRSGMAVVPFGDEAVIHPERFSLNNTSMTDLRHTVNRLDRAGMTFRIRRHGELGEEELRDVVRLTDSWRHGETERGFSMALSRLGDPADARCLLVTAHTEDGRTVGLLSFVPWGSTGVSLDVMRRAPDAPNGTTEFMIAKLLEESPDLGIVQVSLNFAMFRETFARSEEFGAGLMTRFNSSVLGVLDRFLQLERLYQFNQRFNPDWVPRYLCVDSRVSLFNVAIAAGMAEGFLPQWFLPKPSARQGLGQENLLALRDLERTRVVAADLTPQWSDQTRQRIRHLEQLRAAGYEPYPKGDGEGVPVSELARMLAEQPAGTPGAVVGRVRAIREHGGVAFLDLYEHGQKIQGILDVSVTGPETRERLRMLDTGDHVLLRGTLGASRTGTPSLLVSSWETLSKSLHPIPFDSFTDPEARLRRRSVDLIVNPEESRRLRIRTMTIRAIRRTLDDAGFLEVETPMLNTIHGGATARPFKTFINAYGVDLTLRIAPELYLKRLVVGDMGPVYELGRDFRNEGADATHNPEFTVLEAYQPYADYTVMRHLTERLLKNAALAVFGTEQLPLRFGEHPKDPSTPAVLTDVSGPWPAISVCDALSEAVGRPISLETDFEELLRLAREHQIHVRDEMGPGAVIEELYGELVEAKTVRPTFYTDFPVETSPLAGPHRTEPGLAERWDLVVNGTEMGTAYSEMADALEQRRRLTEQSLKAAAGDPEAMQIDEDFLAALETGLPPTGGLGIGIDRLIMMLTDAPIRGVLAFPFVRPNQNLGSHASGHDDEPKAGTA